MSDQSITLGTLFTANISDFLQKTRAVRAELNKFATVSNQLATGLRNLNTSVGQNVTQQNASAQAANRNTQAHQAQGKQIAGVTGAWNRLWAAMRVTASYGVAATAIYGVTNALKTGVNQIIEYDQALKNIQAITGATDGEMNLMGDTILKVAERTKYSANEVAEGMVLLGQAGFTATESISAIQAVADLASGTLSSFADTADLLTTTITAFNLKAVEAGRVADVMANAMNKSKLDIQKLRVAFNYVGETASAAGLKLEETAAAMMVMSNSGLRASTIGTGLRQVISKLMAPTKKIRDAFEEYGISVDQVNPSVVGLQTSVANLSKVLMNDKGVVDMTKAFKLFELRGAQAAAIIVKAFTNGDFQEALDHAYEVGAAEQMMMKQSEGLEFQFKNLGDRAVNLAIALGDAGVEGVLRVLIGVMSEAIKILSAFTKSGIGQAILQFGVWTAAIYGAGVAFTALITIIKGSGLVLYIHNLITVFLSLNKTIGISTALMGTLGTVMKANPWVLVASAVAALVMGMVKLSNRAKEAKQAQQMLVAETEQASSSYKLYADAIDKTNGTGREYESLLERLIKDHPELAKQVDINTNSYKDLVAILRELQAIETEKNLKARVGEIQNLSKELKELKREYDINSTDYGTYLLSGNTAIVKSMETFIKNSKEGKAVFKELDESVGVFSKRLYESFGMNRKGEAMDKASSLMKEWGYDPEVTAKVLNEIDGYFTKYETKRKENEEATKASKVHNEETTDSELNQKKKYYQLMSQMEDDQRRQAQQNFEERKAEIEQWNKEEVERLTKLKGDVSQADVQANTLHFQNQKRLNADLAKLAFDYAKEKIELKESEAKKLIEIDQRAAAGNTTRLDQLKIEEKNISIKYLNDIIAEHQKYYDKVVAIYGKTSEEAIKVKKDLVNAETDAEKQKTDIATTQAKNRLKDQEENLKAQLKNVKAYTVEWQAILNKLYAMGGITEEEYTQKMNKSFEDLFVNIENGYRQGRISQETYMQYLEEAYQKNLVKHDEYIAKKIAGEKSWLAAFKAGLDNSKDGYASLSETMYVIGQNIRGNMADDLTSGLWEFATGAQNAKEMFADFAKSTLKYMFEMIVRQQILNSLMGISGGGGGGGGNGLSGEGYLAHTGGKIGFTNLKKVKVNPNIFLNAPRLHNGLKRDEFPAILQKGEEVIPKNEVNRRAEGFRQEINIIGAPAETTVSKKQVAPNFEKIIIDVTTKSIASGDVDKMLRSVYGLRRVTATR